MNAKVFLLGGYDLEMATIRTLLETADACFVDRRLSWETARLAAYEDILREYASREDARAHIIYGIELREDGIAIPENYRRIDHHNDYSTRPSALAQVAEILGVSLTRRQRLIAANDSGYIPAMREAGASPDEIAEIRALDRRYQSVTEADEKAASEAIAHKIVYGSMDDCLIVIPSATSRFSAVTDRLFPFGRLLIYTDEELMYYGAGKAELARYYDAEIRSGKMFHGGSDSGFIGTAKRAFPKERLMMMKEDIIRFIRIAQKEGQE